LKTVKEMRMRIFKNQEDVVMGRVVPSSHSFTTNDEATLSKNSMSTTHLESLSLNHHTREKKEMIEVSFIKKLLVPLF